MATRRWIGNAVAVTQVDTVTIANTWATSDTAVLTINGKSLTLTVGTAATVTDVALAIVAMVNGADAVDDETRSALGTNVAEFREITATSNAGVVTLTATTPGKPFTLTASETTAGSGTATRAASVACTGPNWWSNANNWSGATVPVNDDTILFDSGNVDLLYDLDPSTGIDGTLKIYKGYTGKIGLPLVNADDTAWKYTEYRPRYFTLTQDSSGKTMDIGLGDGSGSGRINIDIGDKSSFTITIHDTGQSAETGVPAVNIIGGGASNSLDVRKGSVGVAFYQDEAAHFDTLLVSYVTSVASDATVFCGTGVTLANTAVTQTGGTLTLNSANTSGSTTIYAGTCYVVGIVAQATIRVVGGTLYYNNNGTLTTLTVENGGVADFSRDARTKTVTNCVMYKGATLRDPSKVVTFTNGVDVTGCNMLSDVTLDLGSHITVQRSAI